MTVQFPRARFIASASPSGGSTWTAARRSQCTSLPDFSQLRSVVAHVDASGGRNRFDRCAIVASRELLYGLLRVFEVMADRRFAAVRVFRTETDAAEWLATEKLEVRS